MFTAGINSTSEFPLKRRFKLNISLRVSNKSEKNGFLKISELPTKDNRPLLVVTSAMIFKIFEVTIFFFKW